MLKRLTGLKPEVGGNGIVPATMAAMFCLVCGLWITTYVGGLVEDADALRDRATVEQRIGEIDARLQGRIREAISLGKGLQAYVSMHPELSEAEFATFTSRLIEGSPEIRAASLAPGNIVRFVYPMRDKAKAYDLNLEADPQLWPTVRQAMDDQGIFLSEPTELKTGGVGFLVRIPIYIMPDNAADMAGNDTYWGMASLVLDKVALFHEVGLAVPSGGYEFRMERSDYPTQAPPAHLRTTENWVSEVVRLPVHMPSLNQWDIVAYRINSATDNTPLGAMLAHILGIAATLLISVLTFFLVHEVFQVRGLALQDTLTGLANRRLLEDRINQLTRMVEREGRGFHVFYLDLDGFKPINDSFGHETGDLVLKEVAKRLKAEIRNADTAARLGGDEFVVVTCNEMDDISRQVFIDRLRSAIAAPILVSNRSLCVDVSIGVSSYPEDGVTALEILRSADKRMYAKKGNRPRKAREAPLRGSQRGPSLPVIKHPRLDQAGE